MDFNELRELIKEAISSWDHKFIVPRRDMDKISITSPFKLEVKIIEAPYPTVEYIGMEIAKYVFTRLGSNFKVFVKIYEGSDSYALIEYP